MSFGSPADRRKEISEFGTRTVIVVATCLLVAGCTNASMKVRSEVLLPPDLNHATIVSSGPTLLMFGGLLNSRPWTGTLEWKASGWSTVDHFVSHSIRAPLSYSGTFNPKSGLTIAASEGTAGVATWSWTGSWWTVEPSGQLEHIGMGVYQFGEQAVVFDPSTDNTLLVSCSLAKPASSTTMWKYTSAGWVKYAGPEVGPCSSGESYSRDQFGLIAIGPDGTWKWRYSRWERLANTAVEPRVLYGCSAYDLSQNQVLLFGGKTESGRYLNTTWIWNGLKWQKVSPAVSPSPEAFASCGYDVASQEILLAGGLGPGIAPSGNSCVTWGWDGQNWSCREGGRVQPVIATPRA